MAKYGKTWWGQQWLNALSNIDYSNRLPRGRTYANKGSVTHIEFDHNKIKAYVSGSRVHPYSVDITIPKFSESQKELFTKELLNNPGLISKLLNKELDPKILNITKAQGLLVFPNQWSDLKMICSCPDWAVPCKHLAAVIYKVASEIDNNPFLVFNLHDLNLIQELNKSVHISQESFSIPLLTEIYFPPSVKETSNTVKTYNAYDKVQYSNLIDIHLALISLLSDQPPFYLEKSDFKKEYTTSMKRAVKIAQKIVQGKSTLSHAIKEESPYALFEKKDDIFIVLDHNFNAHAILGDSPIRLIDFLLLLEQIPANRTLDYQPSTAAFHTAFNTSLHLIANGALCPQIVQLEDQSYTVQWLPAMLSKEVRLMIEKVEKILPPKLLFYKNKIEQKEINTSPGFHILSIIITKLIASFDISSKNDNVMNLFWKNQNYRFDLPGENELTKGIMAWLQRFFISQGKYKLQIIVEETFNDKFLVSINVQNRDHLMEGPQSLQNVFTHTIFDQDRFSIFQSISQLSPFIHRIDDYLNSKGEELMIYDKGEFIPFLFEMIPAIKLLDIDVLLPKSLQKLIRPKVSVSISTYPSESYIRLDEILKFNWRIAIGDKLLSEEEFNKLLLQSDGLFKYKSNYIYATQEDLEKLQKHIRGNNSLNTLQLLQIALSEEYQGAPISLTDEVTKLINELTSLDEIQPPSSLKATLRPYQRRGYSWLYRNSKIGFGSILADDMGLGKTIQVITTLLKYKEEGLFQDKKALVIAPTGLLMNWQSEFQKFAPTLKILLYHGSARKIENDFEILLTSYGIARSEVAKIKKMKWQSLIIDEAQNIKNHNTAQSKAIKSIGADNYIAMSGTPVENRLSEFWSIMDFSNKGLLGSEKTFRKQFSTRIEKFNDKEVANKLIKATSPFLMRRLKTDKTIISDLPDKIEINSFSTLVKEQVGLYTKTLEEAMKNIEAIEVNDKKGLFTRQGLVLQMILALKQICNHPTQFLKNNAMDASLSGKMDLLFEKLDSILENNEKVLIFTQFAEMGRMLQQFIAEKYGETPLFYHGGCNLKQRQQMVDSFQNKPAEKIFILSLKAAGTGLNLTAASHVIHYDLWWNPAVEAQATDRAYRIGQTKKVMVHRFITKNTFEERIDKMIQSKKALANLTVATGENWIGNLSNSELKDLFEVGSNG
ncbi:DEAD/DEAH box helicase [Membranihabitans marinus]